METESTLPLIAALRAAKRPLTAAPTYTPKNLLDQFALYDTGGVRRLYVWFGPSSGWHYFTAT